MRELCLALSDATQVVNLQLTCGNVEILIEDGDLFALNVRAVSRVESDEAINS